MYFAQKGGQSIMRAFYQPNVPVPTIADVQKYNREILRGRDIIGIRSARTQPVNVWCVMGDGAVANITDEGGAAAWSRTSAAAGLKILDTAYAPVKGNSAFRIVAFKDSPASGAGGIVIAGIDEAYAGAGDVFLDLWHPYTNMSLLEEYGANAVIYDGKVIYPVTSPQWEGDLDAAGDGISDVPVPGNVELDAAYEVYTDIPGPLSIICLLSEED